MLGVALEALIFMSYFSRYWHAINGASLRRFLAVLLAAMLLATGVIHASTCLDSADVPAGIAVVTDEGGSISHDADSPAKTAPDIIHCHGCSAMAVPVTAPYTLPVAASTNIFAAANYSVDADQLPSDPPPPKS